MFPEINWSQIARKAIEDKVKELKRMKMLLDEIDLTDDEVLEFTKKVKTSMRKKYK